MDDGINIGDNINLNKVFKKYHNIDRFIIKSSCSKCPRTPYMMVSIEENDLSYRNLLYIILQKYIPHCQHNTLINIEDNNNCINFIFE